MNNIFNNIIFNSKLNYYKFFNPCDINHYNIINKLKNYKKMGLNYYKKYPNAKGFINLNDDLFKSNNNALIEFNNVANEQNKLITSIIDDVNILSKSDEDLIFKTKKFNSFYIEKKYHIEQYPNMMIDEIKNDIYQHDNIFKLSSKYI